MMRSTRQTFLLTALLALGSLATLPANAQFNFNTTYTGLSTIVGLDANGYLTVTSTLTDPNATHRLTDAKFAQTVFVFVNPNIIVGTSTFETTGGIGADKLFTSYSGIATAADPANGIDVSNISGKFKFTGGTGAFANASGYGVWSGTVNLVTSAVSVNFTETSVPEPDGLALLGGMTVCGGSLLLRRRRK